MISVSGIVAARSRICRAPVTAMSMMPGLSRPKTTRRCSSEVELDRWTIALRAPLIAAKVFSISSARDWVSTWMVTSSGIRSPSMISRTKAKSVSEAAGNPTSISLKPRLSRRSLKPRLSNSSNMRRLRSGPIGSIRAWLPSRRSTLHHCGAWSMVRAGHCRSGKFIGGNGRYLWIGMLGVEWGIGNSWDLSRPAANTGLCGNGALEGGRRANPAGRR